MATTTKTVSAPNGSFVQVTSGETKASIYCGGDGQIELYAGAGAPAALSADVIPLPKGWSNLHEIEGNLYLRGIDGAHLAQVIRG